MLVSIQQSLSGQPLWLTVGGLVLMALGVWLVVSNKKGDGWEGSQRFHGGLAVFIIGGAAFIGALIGPP